LNWSDLGVNKVLTGTVTVLLGDVGGSTRLRETQPEEMTDAVARLDRTLSDVIAAYDGVRPVGHGESGGFVVEFARASNAVACALALQRAALAPIRLRIGLYTGEVGDEGEYIGPTMNRAARVRDLAHGGQTLLSGITEALVLDRLPVDAWLTDLGAYSLRGAPRPERVVQLCHPDLRNEFPPLCSPNTVVVQHLPVQLTTFIGRRAQISDVRRILGDNRLVTLTGAGGVGKTRLAVQIAAQTPDKFSDGVWYVDLAPITDPDLVAVAAARSLGLPDQPGRSMMDTLIWSIGERDMLVVLDNCEHVLDATAALTVHLLGACPKLTCFATSREPIGVEGEVIWRVPSLSLADEAIELLTDRARRVKPDFCITDDNCATVGEICRRVDGMPLAIELAAARVRALSLDEILNGLDDCFRLLSGGSRRALRRHQTLYASVDWSHALLTDPERVLFRRLSVFVGGFDLDAAQVVAAGGDIKAHQVLDEITLLVDKSLVVAENTTGQTRYRLLETVRQYAREKLAECGEAETVCTRHRDHYTAMAGLLDLPAQADYEQRVEQAECDFDNLRAAFAWSRGNGDIDLALRLASSLQPVWLGRGRIREGFEWFDAILAADTKHYPELAPAVRARALADRAELHAALLGSESASQAHEALSVAREVYVHEALAIAREVDDPALLARVLTACGAINGYNIEVARPYFAEAIGLAREVGDTRRLSQILSWQAYAAFVAGDPVAVRGAAEEGRDLADAVGDRLWARECRWCLGLGHMIQGDLAGAIAQFRELAAEADAAHDLMHASMARRTLTIALALSGDTSGARAAATASIEAAAELGGWDAGIAHGGLTAANLAAGDVAGGQDAIAAGWRRTQSREPVAITSAYVADAALARGDRVEARHWADEAVSAAAGFHLSKALTIRARIALAEGALEEAARDAHDALACAAEVKAYLGTPNILECLASLASHAGSYREAARFFGAAQAIGQRNGEVRFQVYQADYQASVEFLRNAMGEQDFERAWAEGAALSTEEAIAYAQRGRGERKRPTTGWASLTSTELAVVGLVSEGLANKDIAARLFVSPRTVQTHLTHIYTKLGLTSRLQLAQQAARHP
jgi:predicted ATPase/class 3 adenylate cyclase/DNA-binding CsgD family transcriptional regulator